MSQGRRDPNRIPIILAELQQLWTANPDLRLGQLLCAAVGAGRRSVLSGRWSTDGTLEAAPRQAERGRPTMNGDRIEQLLWAFQDVAYDTLHRCMPVNGC